MSGPSVREAARALEDGSVVIVPTDTVYGLAASVDRPEAIAEIFALKGRPRGKALPVLGRSVASLEAIATFDDYSLSLAERFWPGALTLVVYRVDGFITDLGGPDDGSVAVRVPGHEAIRRLMAGTGPLAVTSANRSGDEPAGTPSEASSAFPGIPVLDGGRCDGSPSTVVDVRGAPKILRAGPISDGQLDL